jgi:ABC-type amino acid transport substrate-binding protein
MSVMVTGKYLFTSYHPSASESTTWSPSRSSRWRQYLIAAVALLAAGCATTSGGETSNVGADLVQPGYLTVCTDAPYKPFEYLDDSSATGYTGFDLDIVAAIAQPMDLQVVVVDQNYDGLQSGAALAAGQCDIVASAMTITEEREANLDFSDPYYDFEAYDTGEAYGFAVREQGSEALLRTVNAELKKLRDNGTYQEIYQNYFPKR